MNRLKLALPAGILLAGFAIMTTPSYGTVAMGKKEGKSCVYCHVGAGKKELNDTGKCYKANSNSLAKCPAPAEPKK